TGSRSTPRPARWRSRSSSERCGCCASRSMRASAPRWRPSICNEAGCGSAARRRGSGWPGLWRSRRQRLRAVHVWRPRREALGELVMMDSSEHAWLEDRGPKMVLIAMIDDATSRIGGRFVEHDTTEENLRTLEAWLRRWGRPVSLYTDKDSIFQPAGPVPVDAQLRGAPG